MRCVQIKDAPASRVARLLCAGFLLVSAATAAEPKTRASEEVLAAEAAIVKKLRPYASNIQMDRETGRVRFVRLSRAIVDDSHMTMVSQFAEIRYLAVVTDQISEAALNQIADLKRLEVLCLSRSSATDATIAQLSRLPRLRRLYLDHTSVTSDSIPSLAKIPLTTLSLNGVALRSSAVAHVGRIATLEELSLKQCLPAGTSIRPLGKLQSLKLLELDGCQQLTGFAALSAVQPLETLSMAGIVWDDATTNELCEFLDGAMSNHDNTKPAKRAKRKKPLQLLAWAAGNGSNAGLTRLRDHCANRTDVTLHMDSQPTAWERFVRDAFLDASDGRTALDLGPKPLPPLETPSSTQSARMSQTRMSQRVAEEAFTPDFQKHVLPLLGRLGCNGRNCHGSFQGRGGFRLSMFGYDFASDHKSMTQGEEPRVNLREPEQSLIIYKPTHGDEHEGGQRFELGSWQHHLLRNWIAAGAVGIDRPSRLARLEVHPAELQFDADGQRQALRCVAVWANGEREDVTQLARFQSNDEGVAAVSAEGIVESMGRGETHVIAFYDNAVTPVPVLRTASQWAGERFPDVNVNTEVDRLIVSKLRKLGVLPSATCSDETFLRRVCLDITGTLPAPNEVRAFLADKSKDKRRRKIEALLASPAYAEWWTVWLSDLTGSNAQFLGSTDMNQPAAQQWNAWLRRRLQDNVGWDRIAAGLLLATSRRDGQDYASYVAEQSRHLSRKRPTDYTALENPMHYYWFRSNNQQPVDRTLSFGYVFLGVRLQCAQCHKHPFDQWSQQDFEQFSEFFTRIKIGAAADARTSQMQLKRKLGVPERLNTAALRRQMYLRVAAEGLPIPWNEVYIDPPRTNDASKPHVAKLLGGQPLNLNQFADPREPLVRWLLSEQNPYFARAMVNRVWKHYFGVGIVEPADDLNLANPPSNAALLDFLANGFAREGFDLKWLHRTICNSDAYQRSWKPNATNRNDLRNFSHSLVRRLPAEVTIDSILQATASDAANQDWLTKMNGRKIGQHPKSIQARGVDYSLLIFGKPLRTTNCDCERQSQPTLLQSLYVRNDAEMLGWLERPEGWLQQQAKAAGRLLSSDTKATPATKPKKAKPTTEKPESLSEDLLAQWVDQAYLRTLSRLPTESERVDARQHLDAVGSEVEGLRDLMWALLNTQEFLTNH